MHETVVRRDEFPEIGELRLEMSKYRPELLRDLPLWREADASGTLENFPGNWRLIVESEWGTVDDMFVMENVDPILDLSTPSFLCILADLLRVSVAYFKEGRLGAEVFNLAQTLLSTRGPEIATTCDSRARLTILKAVDRTTDWIFSNSYRVSAYEREVAYKIRTIIGQGLASGPDGMLGA